jgi:hypothetical protein
MFGDYISTSVSGGNAYSVLPIAIAPSGGLFHLDMNAVAGLQITGGARRATAAGAANPAPAQAAPTSPTLRTAY